MTPAPHLRRCCPVCGHDDAVPVANLTGVPVFCNTPGSTAQEARRMPRGEIALRCCRACGHCWNAAFDPARLEYNGAYENSLHFSPRFQRYAESLADHLIDRYDLRGRDVLEIGCGKGEFLEMICRRGGNRGVGFDTSLGDRPPAEGNGHIRFVREPYSRRYADVPADLVCCRHVLEHIHTPRAFLQEIRAALDHHARPPLYFEVPNAAFILFAHSVWDLIYEHVSYFSAGSLDTLFRACGYTVEDLTPSYDGQFLSLEARPGDSAFRYRRRDAAMLRVTLEAASAMGRTIEHKTAYWTRALAEARDAGQTVVVWGGGSKGVMFLNILGDTGIEYVVDLNPRKQGRFVAGTGQELIAPEHLRDIEPDTVVLMNPAYREEVSARLAALGSRAELCPA